MSKEQLIDMTNEQWDFKKNEIVSEIDELLFLSKLGDMQLQERKCEELAHKYKTKAYHFAKCIHSEKQSEMDELADTITSFMYGRRPK